ncbi:MAG: hypothetical protein JO332_17910 [Planctomycetaceae bacterium]|nr:hypothetical protein [Planctomycetaceae bacterium]
MKKGLLLLLLAGPALQDLDAEKAAKLYEDSVALHGEKKYEEALRGFARIADSALTDDQPENAAVMAARICAVIDKKSEALRWIEKALALGFRDAAVLEEEADLASVRDEDRFKAALAKLIRFRDGGAPTGGSLGILRLNGEDLEIFEEAGPKPARGDYVAYQVHQAGVPTYLLIANGTGLTRLAEAGKDGALVADFASALTANREVLALGELVWESILRREWERRGSELLEEAEKEKSAPEPGYAALEAALHPVILIPEAASRLAEPYLKLMRDPETPRATVAAAARSLARLPDDEDLSEEPDFLLARACAYFFLRCYPRAAESLKKLEEVEDAAGLKDVLKALGANDWTPGPPLTVGGRAVTVWESQGKPDDPELPGYEACLSVRLGEELRSYLLMRRSVGGNASYFLHEAAGGAETLIEAYGKTKPSTEELIARIGRQLPGPRPAATFPPLKKGEPGRVEVRWKGGRRLEALELRREALEAGVCLSTADSPAQIKGLAPGIYEARLRDAQGRTLFERRVSVEPGQKLLIDVDRN